VLDNATLVDIAEEMVTSAARREALAYLRLAFEVSERRAWLGAERTAVR
jgi:hypothetical protein